MFIYPTPLHKQDVTQGQFLSEVWLIWIQSFPFPRLVCHINVRQPRLFIHSSVVRGRIIRFISFPKILAQCEMQTALPCIWTRVALSVSSFDNRYVTNKPWHYIYIYIYIVGVYVYIYIYIYICIYTHYQLKVFGYPQKLLFLILKVSTLMKQVNTTMVLLIIQNTSITESY